MASPGHYVAHIGQVSPTMHRKDRRAAISLDFLRVRLARRPRERLWKWWTRTFGSTGWGQFPNPMRQSACECEPEADPEFEADCECRTDGMPLIAAVVAQTGLRQAGSESWSR